MTTLNEGDRLRVTRTCCSDAMKDQTGTVIKEYDALRWRRDDAAGSHPIVNYTGYFEKIEDAPPAPQAAPEEPVVVGVEVSPEQALIEQQRAELGSLQDRLNAALLAAQVAKQDHEEDVKKISDFFSEKACENNLCGEYDAAVEEINLELKVEMTPRTKEYTVTVYFRQEISVTARDEDDAIEQARDNDDYGRRLGQDDESEEPDVEESESY